ncbi:hypothetical protein LMH87_010074 [Akanthomyces muscarius]|uniref:Uncharacterized protein n=1 Tax=Akanthomyces muscarius TaxID=2231603 RepID=A0A9W8QF94_AKAMU|nr:hypothetical protein LMH87_010074 [Akanthomyces muscarius]KAJ4153591.1 hypothetical protein LMH87_010074 [Akanthomyces muscarius]
MSQLFSFSVPDLGRHRTATIAAVALLPVILPSVYVVYLNWAVQRTTTCSSGQLSQPTTTITTTSASSSSSRAPPSTPKSIPKDVLARPEDWVVCYERVVSRPIPAATLVHKLVRGSEASSPSPLFTTYLRATFRAFSWTPQAFLIRGMLAEPERKATFGGAHMDTLSFADGDVVDGVYKVTSYEQGRGRSAEVVELSIDMPRSYKGPPVRGLILSALEEEQHGAVVRFVNETWLWRKRDEKPTLLESGLGKWFHSLLAGWLVIKGLGAVTRK